MKHSSRLSGGRGQVFLDRHMADAVVWTWKDYSYLSSGPFDTFLKKIAPWKRFNSIKSLSLTQNQAEQFFIRYFLVYVIYQFENDSLLSQQQNNTSYHHCAVSSLIKSLHYSESVVNIEKLYVFNNLVKTIQL